MNSIFSQSQERDEDGLPLLPLGTELPNLNEVDFQNLTNRDFEALGVPAPASMPSRAKAQKEARERSTNVLADWKKLGQILERHEAVLCKRWMKKTKSSRISIIIGAWPKMSPKHRPDYEAFMREGSLAKTRPTKFREAYLWPYMNVEDLVKGKSLLLLINSRGWHTPSKFTHMDYEATRLGRVCGAVRLAFLNLHSLLLDGEIVETYGRLVSWDEDEEAMMKTFSQLNFQPGEGLLILEIQQRIMRFLVDCCQGILHDFPPNSLLEAPTKSERQFFRESLEWPTLANIAAEAPYRLPASVDFIRLKNLVEGKLTDAEDHIRFLREDPGYFAEAIMEWSEHRQEKLLDTNGNVHPVLGKPLFWERVIRNVLSHAYGLLVAWDNVSQQLDHLAALQSKYSNVINPQRQLPKEYLEALLTFRYSLSQMKKAPVLCLKTGLVASPPFRSRAVREPQMPGTTMIKVKMTRNEKDQLWWLFESLWTERQMFLLDFPTLMDEIETIIQNDPKEKAMLSSWVARVFSDLGLIARIHHELDIYQPWAAEFDHEWVEYKKEIEKDHSRRWAKLSEIDDGLKDVALTRSLPVFGTPENGRFYYPSDKKRNKQTTEAMQKAEGNLDAFWENVDKHYQRKVGASLDEAVEHIFKEKHQFERTPDWIEPLKQPKSNGLPKPAQRVTISSSALSLHLPESSSKFVPPLEKIKPKTRGLAADSSEAINEPLLPTQQLDDKRPLFTLKNRAFKVFRTLFFNPAQANLPGEIPWADFLYAMSETGFALEKMYGSVWQFTPVKLDVERSIQFYEPHPVGKIPFRNARRIGRRLSRAYGWHGGMFALE